MTNWLFAIALAAVCLLIIRQFFMQRAIRLLEEEVFDLRFEIECLEAKEESRIPVTPFSGDKT